MKGKIVLVALILAAISLACGTISPSPSSQDNIPPAATLTVASPVPTEEDLFGKASQFAGSWEGDWNNTTYGSTGDIAVVITVQQDGTASLEIIAGGNVFGTSGVPIVTCPGFYDADGLHFLGARLPVFGDLKILIDYSGNTEMSASLLPYATIATVSSEGSVLGNQITVGYKVTFTGGGQANGTASMTRSP